MIAAVLLALAGEVDETGSGSRVGLVRALTGLRSKVHVVLQSGRLTQGRHDSAIAALLDQFLVQVPWNESAGVDGKSWHAKFILVRQVPEERGSATERWVFMLGSRNLTLDTSWDIGFTLTGGGPDDRDGARQRVEGIARLAADLGNQFPALVRWTALASALRSVTWSVPRGLSVANLQLMLPGDMTRSLPKPMPQLQRLVAVSPFLDKGAVAELGRWPRRDEHTRFQLLSTRTALEGVQEEGGTLAGYELLALAEPELESGADAPLSDDEALEADRIGLHAKMIYAEHAARSTLWLGSPNLTRRAWTRNAECVLQLEAHDKHGIELLRGGLDALLDCANTIDREALNDTVRAPSIEDRLALARNTVAAELARGTQGRTPSGGVVVVCAGAPHPVDDQITLLCGQMKGALMEWPPGASRHILVSGGIESDCVHCRLDLEGVAVSWVQVVPFEPPLDVEQRDAQVLSEYLGSRQMLSWIHSVLTGYSDGDEGGRWDDDPTPAQKRHHKSQVTHLELPTLEQALRMWLKDRSRLDEVDRILELRRRNTGTAQDDVEREQLERFAATWRIIRSGLPRAAS
ncbi:hypothetical protein [Pseudoxanthomonas sp.]|uniref:hypothetical protein n=1 Tax=Pseudoxanthomonas sp. TaxID=1871049 RepID=UPI0035ADD59E